MAARRSRSIPSLTIIKPSDQEIKMTFKKSIAVKNAQLDAIETAIGVSAVLKIRSGAAPTNITDADSGTVLATIALPSDWMAAASGGSKAKSGTWADSSADATGTAAHWRIYASDGTTQHLQGSITATGGGGDMEVDSTSFTAGQGFTVTAFGITSGN
jgi:hypothetical protein